MKMIWNFVEEMEITVESKKRIYILILVVVSALIGALVWFALQSVLTDRIWLLCFMGYPAVFVGFFGSVIYLYNHEFS